MDDVVREFMSFLEGKGSSDYIVPPDRVRDRLDVKHCLVEHNRRAPTTTLTLGDVAQPKEFGAEDVIDCSEHDTHEQLFQVRYDGTAEGGPVILPKTETEYPNCSG